MSLATSPARFAYCTDNYGQTPSVSPGTNFTAGASHNDGAAVTCLSALAHDVHYIRIRLSGIFGSGLDVNALGDLLIDPSGGTTWTALINDLCCGFTNSNSSTGCPWSYDFPLWIPAGASVGWRAKSAVGTDVTTGQVLIEAFGEPANPAMWWCGSGVETLGIATVSKGTSITPGNSGADGSWTNIGSTSSYLYKAIQLGINGSDNNALAVAYHFELGLGSQKLPGSGKVWVNMQSTELAYHHNMGMVGCNIPSGSQLQARGTCSGTAEAMWGAIYGVY